ncbi:MAG TPA: DUF3616 domain-containing protein [Blastocatellia bacterium]|jgi:hypothetical protein|nr:DUF3616 domain-containing protein [Blastocatellia bacterium]
MSLPEARGLFIRYKSFLCLSLAALIGLGLIRYNSEGVESKSALIAGGKYQKKKKTEGKSDRSSISSSGRIFQGGVFEASGVVAVPGTDGVLFIDDGRADEVLWMRIDQDGNQVGEIKPIKIGANVVDPEGITFDGSWFYVVGSQSVIRGQEPNALVRFIFDPETQRVAEVESLRTLYEFLTGEVPELKEYAGKKGLKGTINIEGLAWDPVQERLLLGLRDPLISGQALIVPLHWQDPNERQSLENLALAQPNAIRLSLGGDAIRSIEYDYSLNVFQIISGSPEVKKKSDFKLWEWDGRTSPREKAVLDSRMKPEGVTRVSIDGNNFLFFVCDASGYFRLNE